MVVGESFGGRTVLSLSDEMIRSQRCSSSPQMEVSPSILLAQKDVSTTQKGSTKEGNFFWRCSNDGQSSSEREVSFFFSF